MSDTIRIHSSASPHGELGTIHRDRGLLGHLLAALPDWASAASALNILAEHRPKSPAGTSTDIVHIVAEDLVAAATAGEAPPATLTERAAEARGQLETHNLMASAYRTAVDQLHRDLDDAVQGAEDQLYAALNEQLQDTLDQARALDNHADLLDPDAVLAAGRTKDWEKWRDLAQVHSQIRTAQGKLASKVSHHDVTTMAEALVMRGVEKVFPHWAAWRTRGYLVAAHDSRQRIELGPPWPLAGLNPAQFRVTPDAAAPDFLAWSLKVGAELWVPTSAQHAAEAARLAALRKDPDTETTPLTGADGTEYVPGQAKAQTRERGGRAFTAGAGYDQSSRTTGGDGFSGENADIAWMYKD